jgi:protease IV
MSVGPGPGPQPSAYQPPPVPPQVVYQHAPPPPPPRRPFAWARLFALLFALALVGSLMLNLFLFAVVGLTSVESDGRVQERYVSGPSGATDKVAILSVEGLIVSGEGFFKRQIDRAMKDAKQGNLKAVVLRVNSPGGTINGSDYMYHHLRELVEKTEIPLVVSMGGLAASGGYYVSMAVGNTPKAIYAEPTTWTGSIGVIIPHYDLSGLLKDWHVSDDSIVSGKLKEMGSLTKPMTEEERKVLQGLVNDGFAQFKQIVQAGRPQFKQDPTALDKLATGQVFTADQAKKDGLVDEIGFLEDAVDRAIELAKLDKNSVRVVKYKPELNLVEVLTGGETHSKATIDVSAILELAAPRAYYLYYLGAPLVSSGTR